MRLHPKRAVAAVGAAAIAVGVTIAGGGTAFAAAPYNPDPNAVGTITFTDANGVPVTSGSTTTPMAAYVTGSKLVDAGDADGTVEIFLPVSGQPSASWSGDSITLDTVFNPPAAGWPADIKSLVTAGKPVVNEQSSDLTVAQFEAEAPNTSTTGPNTAAPTYQNLYEVRLYTGTNTAQYNSADISVSGSTWTLVPNPDQTIATTTTLTANPASPTTSANPLPVTLTTTVTPSGSVPSGYIGGIGTVVVKDGATVIDTKIIAPGSAAPFTVTTGPINETNPSTHSFSATFTPFNGTALLGSSAAAFEYDVSAPVPASHTSLSAVWQPTAGGSTPTHFTGTVTGDAPTPSFTAGQVNLYDNGSATPLNASPLAVAADGSFSDDFIFTTAIAHSVVAKFTDPGVYGTSQSAPVTQTLGNPAGTLCTTAPVTTIGGTCDDVQTIEGTVPQGTLTVTTPYTSTNPFNVGTLALDPTGTILTTHAQFGGSGVDQTTTNPDILVTDTRAGDLDWSLEGQTSNLTDGASHIINSQNVGLTGIAYHPAPGFNAAGLQSFDNPAANGVAPLDPGNLGLGGSIKHKVVEATAGIGTVGIYGTLTLNAPTSTPAGTYVGTLTFTIVGGIV